MDKAVKQCKNKNLQQSDYLRFCCLLDFFQIDRHDLFVEYLYQNSDEYTKKKPKKDMDINSTLTETYRSYEEIKNYFEKDIPKRTTIKTSLDKYIDAFLELIKKTDSHYICNANTIMGKAREDILKNTPQKYIKDYNMFLSFFNTLIFFTQKKFYEQIMKYEISNNSLFFKTLKFLNDEGIQIDKTVVENLFKREFMITGDWLHYKPLTEQNPLSYLLLLYASADEIEEELKPKYKEQKDLFVKKLEQQYKEQEDSFIKKLEQQYKEQEDSFVKKLEQQYKEQEDSFAMRLKKTYQKLENSIAKEFIRIYKKREKLMAKNPEYREQKDLIAKELIQQFKEEDFFGEILEKTYQKLEDSIAKEFIHIYKNWDILYEIIKTETLHNYLLTILKMNSKEINLELRKLLKYTSKNSCEKSKSDILKLAKKYAYILQYDCRFSRIETSKILKWLDTITANEKNYKYYNFCVEHREELKKITDKQKELLFYYACIHGE